MEPRDLQTFPRHPVQSVIATMREGVLCGVYPRRLSVVGPDRAVYSCAWRGDRATLLDVARRLAALPPGHTLVAGVVEFVWDHPRDPDRRRRRESTRDLGDVAQSLPAEEEDRQRRRSARRGRVKWRPGSGLAGSVATDAAQ